MVTHLIMYPQFSRTAANEKEVKPSWQNKILIGVSSMKDKCAELMSIIYGMDELLEKWFDGEIASCCAADGEDVYQMADDYRNRAIALIEEIKNSL